MPKTQNDIPAFKTNKDLSWGQNLYAQLLHHAGGDDYARAKIIPRIYENDEALLAAHNSKLAGIPSKIKAVKSEISGYDDSLNAVFDRRDSTQDLYDSLIDTLREDDARKTKRLDKLFDELNMDLHGLNSEYTDILNKKASAVNSLNDLNTQRADVLDDIRTVINRQDSTLNALSKKPFSTKVKVGNGKTVNGLVNTLKTAGGAIKAHPFAAGALGLAGAMNVAGLVDDNKVGAQLIGGAAGAALPALFGASPMTTIALGATGGALGSLFDKLRAKKEAEQQSMYQQQEY